MRGIQRSTQKNIMKILDLLKSLDGPIHLRGIVRATKLNPFIISYILDNYLDGFVDTKTIIQYGFKAKLIQLKEGKENITLTDVMRYLEIRKQIKNKIK